MVEREQHALVQLSYGPAEFRVWECRSGACSGTCYFEPVAPEVPRVVAD